VTTIWLVFWAAVLSDLATGLGVLPVVALKGDDPKWQGITSAAAGGMMLSASIFALAEKAFDRGTALAVLAGMAAGALFVWLCAGVIVRRQWHIAGLSEAASRQSVLIVATLFVHSIPEGVAIGVGYATGELNFGLLLAIVIAAHNIPEGTAVAVPLRSNGASAWRCVWYAVLTSLPQPLVAVPAFLLVSFVQPLLAPSLGFAAGAMIFLVVTEMIPESLRMCSRRQMGWSMTAGALGMLGFISALEGAR
jgi:zinc transporter, ZIP family